MNLFGFLRERKDVRADAAIDIFTARYDFWQGDLSSALDRARIRKLNAERLTEFRWYPLRAAVLALKGNDHGWVASGLAAIAAADSEKIHPECSEKTLAFLFHAGWRVAPNEVAAQFRAAVEMADARRAVCISEFVELPFEAKEARFAAYEAEVHTESGIGFILAGGKNYRPSYDLAQLIVRLRTLISLDQYQPQSVSLGHGVADVSFRKYSRGTEPVAQFERGTELADALNGIRGSAGISARLRPAHDPNYGAYLLSASLLECADAGTREFLCRRLEENPTLQALVQVSEGPLLCYMLGIALRGACAYKSADKLVRFVRPVAEILRSERRIEAA